MSPKLSLKSAALLTLIISLSAGISRPALAGSSDEGAMFVGGLTTVIGGGTALFITAPHVGTIVVAVVGGLASIELAVMAAGSSHLKKENLPKKADLVEISQTGKIPAPYISMFEKVRKDNPGKALDNKLLARILIKAVEETEKARQVDRQAVATGQKNSSDANGVSRRGVEADAASSSLSANK